MSTHAPERRDLSWPRGAAVAIVVARFNAHITGVLLAGCLTRLGELGVAESSINICEVPGAFELPVAAQRLARTGNYSAVICLGAVIRGDTPHFDFVAGQAAVGVMRVALDESLPVIFGVLTTNTEQQAVDRCGGSAGHAGVAAADAAVEMVTLFNSMTTATQARAL